ncbi:RNA-directed DNA polymerase, eukaryota, reverse transcriptase zinc-binding domain protein [Tanacetum coccineum]
MSRIKSWDEIVNKLLARLSKWKMKTLSIGERLTLLKSVLGSTPIYYMSMFKVPMQVLNKMETIRSRFFNGENDKEKKLSWKRDDTFKSLYPRIYALETSKKITVAQKLAHDNMGCSLRRKPRGGVKFCQYTCLLSNLEGVILYDIQDRWFWSLSNRVVPIKVNIHAWKVKLDCLPSLFNLFRREIDIQSIICPCCDMAVETSKHIFFTCSTVREIYRKIATWWDIKLVEVASFEEWMAWMSNIRYHGTPKEVLEDIDVSEVLAA